MPTITFTVEGPSNTTGGELTFTPRTPFADASTGDILTPGKSRRTVEYMCNTEASVDLPDGPWEVGGLEHNVRFPIDVVANAALKDLIVFGLPTTAPVTTLAQAADLWMAANVNTEVSQTLITEALTDPESPPRQVLDGTYVRSVNGTPVGPDGNVDVETAELPDEVVADAVTTELAGRDLLQALTSAGTADDAAVVFTDADGRRGWVEWTATGGLTTLTKLLICAAIGFWRGPTQPPFPPGISYSWHKTDPTTGELIDILDVTT
ncbi:minor tail protein [Gordonia phage Angelique]|nr:minor tail protein [Gordonia phage Angelique]